jgi:hypothetical protein
MFQHLHARLMATALVIAASSVAPAQAAATVSINNLRYEADRHSVVLDISGPVTIATRSLPAPPRLVVDVPAATLMTENRALEVNDALVKRVRMSQFKIIPPTVRIVIETAGAEEPLIAVQQTDGHLYITVAPPRADDTDESPSPAAPSTMAPTAVPTVIPTSRPTATPTPRPTPTPMPVLSPIPTPRPTVPTPRPTPPLVPAVPMATPTPTMRPSPSPLPTPRASRRPDQGGETGNESLPGTL